MAGSTATNHNMVLAQRLKTELVIKGSHAVNFRGRQVYIQGKLINHFAGQIPALFLDILQNGNKIFPFCIWMFF